MKHLFLSMLLASGLISCSAPKNLTNDSIIQKFTNEVSEAELKKQLYIIASDEMQGRDAGKESERMAGDYLKNYYEKLEIDSPTSEGYFQVIPANTFKRVAGEMRNVMAFIKGSEKPEEILVLSAHYDHEGIKNGQIYNGADDDGSGTVAVMEIARVMKEAQKKGKGPKRSILFLHVSGEEKGLLGSRYYSENPIFQLENTIANVNIDMIGRVDDEHKNKENYVYIIGSDMLSSDLDRIVRQANNYVKINLDEKYNTKSDPNRFYYRSDHYNFAKNGIPSVFYFNGVHADYHQPSDTPDKIAYNLLAKRTQLIFSTVWLLANSEERPKVDKTED